SPRSSRSAPGSRPSTPGGRGRRPRPALRPPPRPEGAPPPRDLRCLRTVVPVNAESADVRRLHPEPPRPGPFPSPPPAAAPRRTLAEELAVVLALSLFASAVYAILSFTAAPVNSSVSVAVVSQTPRLVEQIADIVLALPPVWL